MSGSHSPHQTNYKGLQQYPSPTVALSGLGEETADLNSMQQMMQQQQMMMQMMMQQQQQQQQLMERMQQRIDELQPTTANATATEATEAPTEEAASKVQEEAQAEANAGNTDPDVSIRSTSLRMPTLTLGEYSGVKYDGSPDKFSSWEDTITTKLEAHKVAQCIDDDAYQGRYLDGRRVQPGAHLQDLISDGTDLQSQVAAFITGSLSGNMHTKVQQLRKTRKEQPASARRTLTAFEVFEYVRSEAKPILAYKSRKQVGHMFRNEGLARGAGRTAVDAYIAKKREHWVWLNDTGGGKDIISEHTLVEQLLSGMELYHEATSKVLTDASEGPSGELSLSLFMGKIDSQFPKDYSSLPKDSVNITETAPPCDECGEIHHRTACPHSTADDEKHKARKEKREEKRARDKAWIQLGKAKEQELVTAAARADGAFHIAPPAPHAPGPPMSATAGPAAMHTVQLPGGISVHIPRGP